MIRTLHTGFAAGELAPELHMRSDLKAYSQGAAKMLNMYPRRTGSAMIRPGTELLAVDDLGVNVKIIPFFYDRSTSFFVLLAVPSARAYQASPVLGATPATFSFAPAGWVAGDMPFVRYKQVGDTLFVSAPGRTPVRIIRSANNTWTTATEQVETLPAYNVAASLFTETRAGWDAFDSGKPDKNKYVYYGVWARNKAGQLKRLFADKPVYISKIWESGASVKFNIQNGNIPQAAYGDTWILCKKRAGAYGEIGSFEITVANINAATSGVAVTLFEDDNVMPDGSIGTQTNIRTGDDAGGYALLDFYQQRQVLTGNANAPWSLWFSRLGDLYNWTANRPTDEADPFRVTLPALRASAVKHSVSGQRLLLFTEDGIYAVHSDGDGFSALTCRAEKVNPIGAGAPPPIETGASVIFVAADDATLLEMRYSFGDDSFITVDRSVLSRHLTQKVSIIATAWQPHPDAVLWVLLSDGKLLSLTYLPEHEVYGWVRHEIHFPNSFYISNKITDIVATGSVLPTSSGAGEATSCIILYFGGPVPSRAAVLRMTPASNQTGELCLDCREKFTLGVGASRTVDLMSPSVQKTGAGPWTLGYYATKFTGPGTFEFGMPVQWELETLRPESPERAVHGLRRRIVGITVRTLATGRFKAGDAGSADGLMTDVTGEPANAQSGVDIKLPISGGWDWEGRVRLTGSTGERAEIMGMTTDIEIEGRG